MFLGASIASACNQQQPPSVACTAPRGYWQKPHFIGGLEMPKLEVTIDHDSFIYVKGQRVTLAQLESQLRRAATIHNPDVGVALDTEMGASCKTLEEVRDIVDRTTNCRQSGRCAEGSRVVWMNWPSPPDTPPS
jgi:hypothetical protein